MESIKSVQENPFFKHFGIKHNIPPVSRRSNLPETHEPVKRHSVHIPSSFVDDDIGEYRPVSGFVHKLLDKFTSLGAREEQAVAHSFFKRSPSLDDQQVENEIVRDKLKTSTDRPASLISNFDKHSYLSTSNLSHRARSVDGLNHAHSKQQQYNSYGVSFHAEKRQDKNNQRDQDLTRDNILIIENTPSVPLIDIENDRQFNYVSGREVNFNNELPKPNTVLTVRNIFENASYQANLYAGRNKPDQSPAVKSPSNKFGFSPVQTDVMTSSQDGASRRGSIQTPSPIISPRHESHARPVLLPSSSTLPRTFEYPRRPSDSYLNSRSQDVQSTTTTSSASFRSNSESVKSAKENDSSITSPSSTALSSIDKSRNSEKVYSSASRKSSSDQPSIPSTYNMASIKPALSSNQSFPETPSPVTAPVLTYQKSRPVVSVAPYKDSPEGGKNDEQSILSESKPSLKTEKSQGTKDSTQFDNSSMDLKLNKDTISNETETIDRKAANDQNNKAKSHGKKSIEINNKNAENLMTNLSKTIPTKNHTTIDVKEINVSDLDKGHFAFDKFQSLEKGSDLKLVAASSTKLTKHKRMAPEPPHESATASSITLRTHTIKELPNKDPTGSSGDTGSMLETSKQITAPSRNTKTEATVKSGSQEEPVKGIPSIIAQRLKQQNPNPSHVATDVINSSETSVQSNNIYSRTRLAPVGTKRASSSSDNEEKDTLSSEIENEITAVKRKIEANRLKTGGPSQIFDSSQLTKKKKNNQKQQTPSEDPLPLQELSMITDDNVEYQPLLRKVAPCNIIFIGENSKTSRSLLDKKRKIKISIQFDDLKTETFEYLREEVALEMYLEDHPHEKEEILVLEDFSGKEGESSDDVEVDVFVTTPKEIFTDSLAHSGNLQSYRGRYQQDFEFGTISLEEPQKKVSDAEELAVDPEKLMLRPAEEDDTNNWSTSDSSDLLF